MPITDNQFTNIAARLGVEKAVVKAVAEVESRGNGFMENGAVKILYERHIFYRAVHKRGIDPEKWLKGNEEIIAAVKKTHYGGLKHQWDCLNGAIAMTLKMGIDDNAAYESASYGGFQVLGANYSSLGYSSAKEFFQSQRTAEGQLKDFATFIKANHMQRFLQLKQWTKFALRYNGRNEANQPGGAYHLQLQKAYEKYSTPQQMLLP